MQDEIFCSCRFSQTNEKNLVLYTAAVTGRQNPIYNFPELLNELFFFCIVVSIVKHHGSLYVTGKGGSIATWNTTTWKRISSKSVVRDTILAFDVSADGKFLAW